MMGVFLSKCSNCNAPLKVDRQDNLFYCEYCGAQIFDQDREERREFRARAGSVEPLRGPTAFCRQCGGKLFAETAFCPTCGSSVEQAARPLFVNVPELRSGGYADYPYRSKWAAFFLCLLFGSFGAHRFYVGKSGTGILWLMTIGLFGIGWAIDLMLILFGGFRDKAGWPLR